MQTHRETAEVSLAEAFAYLVWLKQRRFFGEVRFKYRDGDVVGHVHEDRDLKVDALPQAKPEEIAEALKGVISTAS